MVNLSHSFQFFNVFIFQSTDDRKNMNKKYHRFEPSSIFLFEYANQ